MIIISLLILGIWLLAIPTAVGTLVGAGVDKQKHSLPFLWTAGQTLLWAVFQLLCVPFILLQKDFYLVEYSYLALTGLLLATAAGVWLRRRPKKKKSFHVVEGYDGSKNRAGLVLWAVFWILLAFQLFQAVAMTYGDGDDAYYVAVSTVTENSDTMYRKLPYTGGATQLDSRHGLAPFPVWIAFLSRVSGMRTVSVAHVVVPVALIAMTYAIYYLIGRKLCGRKHKERLPLFLCFTSLLVLFGDYSFYSVENFMIARSRQGKAALGSIVIPMAIYILLLVLERLQEKQRIEKSLWALLCAAVITGCLCSTLGALLISMLLGVTGICAAVCYKRWKLLLPVAACCVPAVCYAVLYLILD